jgi:hypothetical protein
MWRPPTGNLSPRSCASKAGSLFTRVWGLSAHPLHAAVAHARFGVPDGYVAPHDSPAAYARASEIEAARAIASTRADRPAPADRGGHEV